jgi:hypothetical protein
MKTFVEKDKENMRTPEKCVLSHCIFHTEHMIPFQHFAGL